MGVGFCPQLGGVGPCPAQCIWQGSGFAADQTNAMLAVGGTSCISLISVVAADENSLTPLHRLLPAETQRSGFGGSPVGGGDKNSRVIFFTFLCGGITYPPVAVAVSEQPGAGFISAEKTAFSEWVLCADGHAVPSCTQRFFGVPAWGWYHYPRRALHAVETLDAQGTRWLNKLLVVYSLPVGSASAHSGSHGETRGGNEEPPHVGRLGCMDSLWSGAVTPVFPPPFFQSSPAGSAFLPVSSPCCREPCALSCSQCAGMFQTDPIHYPVFPCR